MRMGGCVAISAGIDPPRAPLLDAAELLALVDNDSELAQRVTDEAGLLRPVVEVVLGRSRAAGTVDDAALGVLTNLHLSEREIDFFAAMTLPVALTTVWPSNSGPRIHMRPMSNMSLMHVEIPRFDGRTLLLKRAFDIFASGLGFVLLSPLFLVIASSAP